MDKFHLPPGAVLMGKYRIERVLGSGGMGVVVLAQHLELDQPVALKFLLPHAAGIPEVAARFAREARAAVKLRSQHVARVIDVGKQDDGTPYMVMEYLQGQDLAQLLARVGRLAVPEAIDYLLQGAEAVAEAHTLGIVHRDLKPHNFFLTEGPDGAPLVKVLDFGISKVTTEGGDSKLTATQAVMGTPAYMSPEQMRSASGVDARTDVWALGVVLYELVTGQVPWPGDSFAEICLKVAMDPMPRPGYLPPELVAVLDRSLGKTPEERYGSVHELAVALAPFASAAGQQSVQRIARVTMGRKGGVSSPGSAEFVTPLPGSLQAVGSVAMNSTLGASIGQMMRPTAVASAPKKRGAIVVGIGVAAAALAVAGFVIVSSMPGGGSSSSAGSAAPAAAGSAPASAVTREPEPPPAIEPAPVPVVVDAGVAEVAAEVTPEPEPEKRRRSRRSRTQSGAGSGSTTTTTTTTTTKPDEDFLRNRN